MSKVKTMDLMSRVIQSIERDSSAVKTASKSELAAATNQLRGYVDRLNGSLNIRDLPSSHPRTKK